jgi:hypothetical protein
MKTFKSFREKYKSVHSNDKLGTLKQEIENLTIRNRNENDSDIGERIEQLRKQHDDLVAKYSQLSK